jgi:hypothetical protein
MHRGDRALEALLRVIAGGAAADAKTAIESLASRRSESGLLERVRDAAARNGNADLSDLVATAFARGG